MPVTFKLRELGVLRARDMPRGRGDPGRGPRAGGAVRRQGRRRDRPGADRGGGGRRARGLRRHPPHDAADEGLARGARDERRASRGGRSRPVAQREPPRASSTPTRTSTPGWRRSACRRRRPPPGLRRRSSSGCGGGSIARSTRARCAPRRAVRRRGAAAGTTALVDHHESPNFIEGSLDVLADACQELGHAGRALLRRDRAQRRARRGAARPGRVPALHPVATAGRWCAASSGCTPRSPCRTRRSARPARCAASSGTVLHVHVAEDRADVADARARGCDGPLERLERAGRAAARLDPRARRPARAPTQVRRADAARLLAGAEPALEPGQPRRLSGARCARARASRSAPTAIRRTCRRARRAARGRRRATATTPAAAARRAPRPATRCSPSASAGRRPTVVARGQRRAMQPRCDCARRPRPRRRGSGARMAPLERRDL